MLHTMDNRFEEQACALSHSPQRTPGLVLAALVCPIEDHERGIRNDRACGATARSGRPVWRAAEDRSPRLDTAFSPKQRNAARCAIYAGGNHGKSCFSHVNVTGWMYRRAQCRC